MNKKCVLLPGLIVLISLAACAHLDKGADPIVVRAEQSASVAAATFDTFLKIDNSNRDFFRTNLPPFHGFAEYLRAPIVVNGTNLLPRGLAFVISLQSVKQAYKGGTATSNVLVTAIAVLESSVSVAQNLIAQQQQETILAPAPTPSLSPVPAAALPYVPKPAAPVLTPVPVPATNAPPK
jgi:hypothetical protein